MAYHRETMAMHFGSLLDLDLRIWEDGLANERLPLYSLVRLSSVAVVLNGGAVVELVPYHLMGISIREDAESTFIALCGQRSRRPDVSHCMVNWAAKFKAQHLTLQ